MIASPRFFPTLLGLVLLSSCSPAPNKNSEVKSPPPEVGVITLVSQAVTLTTELPGRTSAYQIAEVRPQVSGVIQKRLFTEGSPVELGQQLFQIDPAPYQASYESALASLAHARAALNVAQQQASRYQALSGSNAISQQDLDNILSTEKQAEADVASAQAVIKSAEVNLAYTKVIAPISGQTGRATTVGALVTANQSNVLVTIQQLDPIYVDIPESSTELVRLRREIEAGQIASTGPDQASVRLTLEDGSSYDQPGRLQFSEVTVDQGTGSVILRAVFTNPKHLLLPGMFVLTHLDEGVSQNGILVPQQGVTHNTHGDATVLLVNHENQVELRTIKADRTVGDKWLVTDGLEAGDKVILSGVQKVKPGEQVHATEIVSGSGTTAAQP